MLPGGRWRLIIVVLVAFSGLLLFSFGGLVLSNYNLNRQAESLREEIENLKAQNEELQNEVKYWESDEGLERLAREQLGWVKPGDTGVVILPSEIQGQDHANPAAPVRQEAPNWQLWWDMFFGG